MDLLELFIIAVGVSMDAFAVAVCKGLSLKNMSTKISLTIGLYFGFFQAVMPLIGYYLGVQFSYQIMAVDHWIGFLILSIIGLMMIKESRGEACKVNADLRFKTMILLAIATSIDAFAVGVTFAFLRVNIIEAVLFIGIVTFTFSFIGVKIGNIFGLKYKSRAEFIGGLILILMGAKILFEHFGIM